MLKASRILLYSGLIGVLSCFLFRVCTHSRELYIPVMVPSYLAMITGMALTMPASFKKQKSSVGILSLVMLCIGLLLISAELTARWLCGITSRPILLTGLFILIGTVMLRILSALAAIIGITGPKGVRTSSTSLIAHGITDEDLNQFSGIYKNKKMPMTITVRKKESTLTAQANGQGAFYLDAVGKTAFEYKTGGIENEFYPDKNEFILKQHGGFFPFVKE